MPCSKHSCCQNCEPTKAIPCQFVCCGVGCLERTTVTALPCLQRDDFSDMALVVIMRLRSKDPYRGIFARAHGHASRCLRQVRLNLAVDANVGQFSRDTRAAASGEELKPPITLYEFPA